MTSIKSTLGEKDYQTKVTTVRHSFYVDQPLENGGSDIAPGPTDYLLGALASCIAITIKMYCQKKEWDIGEVNVDLSIKTILSSEGPVKRISKSIRFEENLSKEKTERILEVSKKCPISKILTEKVEIVDI